MTGESPSMRTTARPTSRAGAKASAAFDKAGRPATGRVHRVFAGQGHGFIRLADDRDVFFHRSDLMDGTVLRDLHEGATVEFDLLDDPVSGPRAMHVRLRAKPQRTRR